MTWGAFEKEIAVKNFREVLKAGRARAAAEAAREQQISDVDNLGIN